jgi:plasmid maintenance system antidote protein VapI
VTDLTTQEQAHVRATLRYLRARCGGRSWEPLGKALRLKADSLSKVAAGRRGVSAGLAVRVARLARTGIDDLLAGRSLPLGACPNCGHYEAPAAA